MQVMFDTKVWIDLKEESDFLEAFCRLYKQHEFDVVFSHGNFLDLVRRDNQDELSYIIDEFTDEYLGPFDFGPDGAYSRSDGPLVLAMIDESWHQYCARATAHLDNTETLKAMFRDADFDAEPASSATAQFIEQIRLLEDIDIGGRRMDIPADTPRSEALKKIGIFAEYAKERPDGMAYLVDTDIPLKKYVFGMSLIYISETYHEPEIGDYRDAIIWSQAISCECDVLWAETKWKFEHPVISQVLDRLERKRLDIVHDFENFQGLFD